MENLSHTERFRQHHGREPQSPKELMDWMKASIAQQREDEQRQREKDALRRLSTAGAPGEHRNSPGRRLWTEETLEDVFDRHTELTIHEKKTHQHIKSDSNATVYYFKECPLRPHSRNEKDQGRPGSQGLPSMTLFSSGNIAFWCHETECDCESKSNDERLTELAEYLDEPELFPRKSGAQILQDLTGKSLSMRDDDEEDDSRGTKFVQREEDESFDYDEDDILETQRKRRPKNDQERTHRATPSSGRILSPDEGIERPAGGEYDQGVGEIPNDPRTENPQDSNAESGEDAVICWLSPDEALAQSLTTTDAIVKEGNLERVYDARYLMLLAQINTIELEKIRVRLEQKFKRSLRWGSVKEGITNALAVLMTLLEPEGDGKATPPPTMEDGKPIVYYDPEQDVFGGRIVDALHNERFFSFGGTLAEVITTDNHHYQIRPHTATTLRAALSDYVRLKTEKTNERTGKTTRIPYVPERDHIFHYLIHQKAKEFPALDGIVDIPIVKPNGELVLDDHTYDEDTRLFYAPNVPLFRDDTTKCKLVGMVSQEDATKAMDYLWRFFRQFPFDSEASKANYLGLLLTLILRPTIPGHCPLFLIDASTRGIGKTLLALAAIQIRLGRALGSTPLPGDNEEMRKKIGGLLATGDPLVHFDEVQSKIYHPALAQVLTEHTWQDRRLGSSSMLKYPNKALWPASGNNVQIGGDFDRRVALIRLVSDEERPEQRDDLEIDDFPRAIERARGAILFRLYLIAKAWLSLPEDQRPYGKKTLGASFSDWSGMIGGMLAYVGIDGFLENMEQIYEKDETTLDWGRFLAFWYNVHKSQKLPLSTIRHGLFGSREHNTETYMLKTSNQTGGTKAFLETLPEFVIQEVEKIRNEVSQTKCLGRFLKKIVDRNYGGFILREKTYDNSNNSAQWWIEKR